MINLNTIGTEFTGLVGWRQDTEGATLDAGLTASSSGLTYNRHPLLTLANLEAAAPDTVAKDLSGVDFNTWLTGRTLQAVKEAMSHWWSSKWAMNTARPLMSKQQAYTYDNYSQFNAVATGKRLGCRVTPKMNGSYLGRISIDKVSVRLAAPGTITVHFHPVDSPTATQSQEIVYTGNGTEQWVNVSGWSIPGDSKGAFIYFETEEATPSVMTYRGNCNCRNSMRWCSVTGIDGSTDAGLMIPGVTRENYGVNLILSAECDYTDFLVDNKDLFADYLSLSVASHFLRLIANNPNARLNRNEGMIDPDRVLYEIDGNPQGRKTGLSKLLHEATEGVHLQREGFDTVCLPCNENAGISRMKTA
jgi:hypothetical protein